LRRTLPLRANATIRSRGRRPDLIATISARHDRNEASKPGFSARL